MWLTRQRATGPRIAASVRKTGRLIALDTGSATGTAGEIVARTVMTDWSAFICAPRRLAVSDAPEASSPPLTRDYHVRAEHIAATVARSITCWLIASRI
jgi:acetoin:2,6-dichlorophenolindophenol oxidoreductase subunit beta